MSRMVDLLSSRVFWANLKRKFKTVDDDDSGTVEELGDRARIMQTAGLK